MALYTPNDGDTILAAHVAEATKALTGVAGFGVPIALTQLNDSANYALDVRNLNTTNSRGLRVRDGNGNNLLVVDASGITFDRFTFSPQARSIAAETQLGLFGAATFTGTTGIPTQRFYRFAQPTLAFTAPQTVTTAATVAIAGAVAVGANATLTNNYALLVEAGASRFAGAVTVDSGGLTVTAGGATITAGGLTVTAGGLSVAAGTTAVQALTATTGTFSGAVTTGGLTVATLTGTETLTNKTLTSPTINGPTLSGTVAGTPTWASGQTFPSVTTTTTAALGTSLTVGTTVNVGSASTNYGGNIITVTGGTVGGNLIELISGGTTRFKVDGNGQVVCSVGGTPTDALIINPASVGGQLIRAQTNNVNRFLVDGNGVVTMAATANQFVIGTTRTITLNLPTPATASRTITFPDPGANDSLVYLALAQTLTNKTLTSPTLTNALLTTPTVGTFKDTNGNDILTFSPATNAVNYVVLQNAPTGSGCVVSSQGADANVDLALAMKGSGKLNITATGITQISVGAAGGASALPATPSLYLRLKVNNTEYVVPLYAQA